MGVRIATDGAAQELDAQLGSVLSVLEEGALDENVKDSAEYNSKDPVTETTERSVAGKVGDIASALKTKQESVDKKITDLNEGLTDGTIKVKTAEGADKLNTARNLKVALGSTSSKSFDGSAAAEDIGVNGTLAVANGGTGQTDLDKVTVGEAKKTTGTLTITDHDGFNGEANVELGEATTTKAGLLSASYKAQLDDLFAAPTASSTLDENDWDVIDAIAAKGLGPSYWEVGDPKAVELSGTVGTLTISGTYYVYIGGFDHNADLEGKNRIHFLGFLTAATGGVNIGFVDSAYNTTNSDGTLYFNMNHWGESSSPYNTNYGGWAACDMRYDILGSTDIAPQHYGEIHQIGDRGYNATESCAIAPVKGTLMACLPESLRKVMKPMVKYTDNAGNSSNVESGISATVDYLPLLSEYEVQGSRSYANTYEQNYQKRYDYYVNGNSRVKYRSDATGTAASWWCRSPYYNTASTFCIVDTLGGANTIGSRFSYAVAPAFAVGQGTL